MTSIPVRIYRWSLLCVSLGALLVSPAAAQSMPDTPDIRTAETRTNLFATLDLSSTSADGLRVDLPRDWTLREAVVLRYGSQRVPVQVRPGDTVSWIVPDQPLRGPYEVVLRVETGTGRGPRSWSVVPATRRGAEWELAEGLRVSRRVTLEASPRPDATNRALSFSQARRPMQVAPEALPTMDRTASFTAELWLRTTGLDEVVLSTWSGNENEAYPLELVIDPSGRLRSYCGRPGRHQALMSQVHVADGRWHHAAVVYAAERRTLRLVLDGMPVDSLTDVDLPVPSRGASRLALGGRLAASGAPTPSGSVRFSGSVDEVRLWSSERSIQVLRNGMRRPTVSGPDLRVQLGFDTASSSSARAPVVQWPEGTAPTPSTLSLRTALQDFEATADGSAVHLRWAIDASNVRAFVVERSTDGATFSPLSSVTPREVAHPDPEADGHTFTYTDENVPGQVVFYRIRRVYVDGITRTSGILKIGLGPTTTADSTVELLGNYPNPFTETTTIAYEVNERESVTLSVWNLTGNRVANLVDERQSPGRYELRFDASDLPSGTYFVRLQTSEGIQSHRMVVLK